jgi:hypothetical protein
VQPERTALHLAHQHAACVRQARIRAAEGLLIVIYVHLAPIAAAGDRRASSAPPVSISPTAGNRAAATHALPELTVAAARLNAQRVLLEHSKDPLHKRRVIRALLALTAAAGKRRALCVPPALSKAELGNQAAALALPALTAASGKRHAHLVRPVHTASAHNTFRPPVSHRVFRAA